MGYHESNKELNMSDPTRSSSSNTVAVWRDHILGFSETFIADQALGLRRWHSFLVGLERRPSPISLPEERIFVPAHGLAGRMLGECVRRLRWLPPWWLGNIRAQRPDLIHAHYAVDACHALPLAKHLHIPLLVTCHGYDVVQNEALIVNPSPTFRRYQRRRRELIERTARFLTVSNYARNCMIAKGFPPGLVEVAYIGVDVQYFDGLVGPRQRPVVMFVGRLSPEKGIMDLLAAMIRLKPLFPGLHLQVAGDGPELSMAQAEARRAGMSVTFMGAVPKEVVRETMREAQVLCVPSRTFPTGAQETFGLVFSEAQAMRLPVVSNRIGGIPEAVEHGQAGILCKEGNIAELTEAIGNLLHDRDLRIRMGEQGRMAAETTHNRTASISTLERVYDEVVAGAIPTAS